MNSLADRIPNRDRSVDAKGILFVLSFAGAAFLALTGLLYTLERLGMPGYYSNGLLLACIAAAIALLSWLGRTVSGPLFFFAARRIEALPAGLGAAFCWLSGAVVIVVFELQQPAKFLFLAAMTLGLALQAFVFAGPMNASGTSTLPGLLIWRFRELHTGLISLAICLLVLAPVALAEFQVAAAILSVLSGWPLQHAVVAICLLALFPALFGGWQGLLLVNTCIGLWILACMLVPALVTGFLPAFLEQTTASVQLTLQPLQIADRAQLIDTATGHGAAISLIIFGIGFATMPQLLARSCLTPSRIVAVEGLGWAGLVMFLALSALLLSVGLIVSNGFSTPLGEVLRSSNALAILPYAAIFLSALNALAATLFVAANTVVRTVRSYRDREAGVGSMFAVRLTAVALAMLLWLFGNRFNPGISTLILTALALAGAGFFPVLAFCVWKTRLSALISSAAMVMGVGTTLTALLAGPFYIATCGFLGALASTFVLVAASVLNRTSSAGLMIGAQDSA